jgi:DNA polymerase-3 subunit gamma/tau
LSALNVVNESELEYKNANNRRLHTELCLIRLCYVLQATKIESGTEKKNDSPKPEIINAVQTAQKTETERPIEQHNKAESNAPQAVPEAFVSEGNKSSESTLDKGLESPKKASPFGQNETGSVQRRVSKNMLSNTSNHAAESQKMLMSELSIEMVERIFNDYKLQLKEENKSILYNALETVKLEMPEEGSLHLTSPNSITDSYAQSERGAIQELIKKETGLLVRISNSFVLTENEPGERALSKAEIFAAMAEKNPMLHQLKDALKMSIDY